MSNQIEINGEKEMNAGSKLTFREIEEMVHCSFCRQSTGQACVTKNKESLKIPHMVRIREAHLITKMKRQTTGLLRQLWMLQTKKAGA